MMRRSRMLLALLTTLALILSLIPGVASAVEVANYNSRDLTSAAVKIDGRLLDADAYLVDGRTFVPLRKIFEALGVPDIGWEQETKTVTAIKGNTTVILQIGNPEATVNGKTEIMAAAAILIDSRTFVPLRFVSQALGAEVNWDQANRTAIITTNSNCALAPYQQHEGTIQPGGETWGKCGSPHVVTGDFRVEGSDSPILTIEAGATIQFKADAYIEVGRNAPGGMVVNGTTDSPAVFTAATSGPQPGYWAGLRFYNQTLVNQTVVNNARFMYGGQDEYGTIYVEGYDKPVEIQLNNVEIQHSLFAGIRLAYQGRLKAGSANLKISDTVVANGNGGFPIVTAISGSNNLPRGEFKNNAVNAVNISEDGSGTTTVATNTTWKNVSIPYAVSQNVYVEGAAAPTLTIEPGVITLWNPDTGLIVGASKPGYLVADAKAKPEGNGDWFSADWNVGKTELDLGAELANAASIEPTCSLCGNNHAIVFGAWAASPERGAWNGIDIKENAGDKSKLNGAVVAWGGIDDNYGAGLMLETNGGKAVKATVSNSMFYGSARSGLELYGTAQVKPESTGNYFVNNGWPVRVPVDAVGLLPTGQTFTDNSNQYISVYDYSSVGNVTKTATWRNHGIPYQVESTVFIGSSAKPIVTIEAGTELIFSRDTYIRVGTGDGAGSLVAKGQAGKPIKFTSDAERPGSWNGIVFTTDAGKGNTLEYTTIEYATTAVTLDVDLGTFIKNTTIRSSSEQGIYRADVTGTSFTTGLGNQFEGNAIDQNME